MTSFSYNEHHSFLLDSSPMFLIPDTTTNMSCFSEQYSILNICKPCFSPQQHHPIFYDQADPTVDVLPSVNISTDSTTSTTKISTCSNNSSSFAASGQYHQVTNPTVKRKKSFQQPHSKLKGKKPRKETTTSGNIDGGCITTKSEEKMKNKRSRRSGDNDRKKKKKKNSGDQETERNGDLSGYVHVRARRGQATDSHSLAERVRRERISERMKLLQALVPGCDKVTGKALMLDEIINYVQSLQTQIEFLTLKIASVDPMFYDYVMNLNAVQNQTMTSLEATNQANVQQQNHTQATYNIVNASGGSSLLEEPNQQNDAQATDNMFITSGGYSIIHTSTLLQQQAHMSNIMSQFQSQSESSNNRQLLWDADEQRQSMINHSGFINNLSSSLHMH